MFNIRIETATFTEKLNEYARLTKKAIADVIREQAKLLASSLVKLTYPKTSSQGKKRVALDVGKVFLLNKWFEDTFNFTNKRVGDRIKEAVRRKNEEGLKAIFERSPKLRQLHVEPFDKSRHERARKDGRVFYKGPNSFPVAQQSDVKSLINEKKKAVGNAKGGWAMAGSSLGGNLPSWLSKAGMGTALDQTGDEGNPRITLINRAHNFAMIDRKAGIVERALAGRGRDMIKSAERQVRQAAKDARLAG